MNDPTIQKTDGSFNVIGAEPVDIVLIYPPWPVFDHRAMLQNNLPPLGILSIASYMESLGYSVAVHDVHAEYISEDEIRERLRKNKPKFIGISVLTTQCIPAHKIAKIAKEVLPETTIIVGGVHAEVLPETMLRNSAIEIVARGDGEEIMREIVQGKPYDQIEGISYRDGNRVRHNAPRTVNMDLDKYPFPAYHLVDFSNYFPAIGSYRNLPAINMLMTRGCPGKCIFCNSANTALRCRSSKRVVKQIEHLNKVHGIRQVQFHDDTFTVLKKNALAFCKEMEESGLGITWVAYIRGDCFSEDMAKAMKAGGCHQVMMGIESGSPEICARIGKPIDQEKYKEAVELAHKHGLEVRGSFIIGNLGETWETMEKTLDFAIELDVDIMMISINTPYPGTALFNEAEEKGMLKHKDWNRYGVSEVKIEQPQISDQEIYKFEKYAFRRFYLRPKILLRMLKRIANFRHIRDYVFASLILLLGKHKQNKRLISPDWQGLREADFLDLIFEEKPPPRLTHEVRQLAEFH